MANTIRLNSNLDTHYFIHKEVGAGLESIDLPACFLFDHSYLNLLLSLSEQSISKPASIDNYNLNSELSIPGLDAELLPSNGAKLSPSDFIKTLEAYRHSLVGMLTVIPYQESVLQFFMEWSKQCAKSINHSLSVSNLALNRILIDEKFSANLVDTIFDDLSTSKFIDKTLTTANLTTPGLATSALSGAVITLEPDDISQSVKATGLILADYMDATIVSETKSTEQSYPYLVSRRIYVNDRVSPVGLEVIVSNEVDYKNAEGVLLQLSANNGIESIIVTAAYKGSKTAWSKTVKVKSHNVFIPLHNPAKDMSSLSISLVSSQVDSDDALGAFHIFAVKSIRLLNTSSEFTSSVLQTKELKFSSEAFPEGKPFRSLVVDINSGQSDSVDINSSRLQAFVNVFSNGKWSGDIAVRSGDRVNVTRSATVSNESDRTAQLSRPFTKGGSRHVCSVNFNITDVAVSDLTKSFSDILAAPSNSLLIDPDEMVVLRGVGSKIPFTSSASSLLSDVDDAGWVYSDGYYKTNVFIPRGRSHLVDFGQEVVIINGTSQSGLYEFVEGVHQVEVFPDNYLSLAAGLSPSEIKYKDSLYPYNHKYLIQGYPNIVDYPGVSLFARQVCRYVDPEYLLLGLHEEETDQLLPTSTKYPALFSLYRGSGANDLQVILPIDKTYTDFWKERTLIWTDKFNTSDFASKLKLKIVMKTDLSFGATTEPLMFVNSYSIRGA